jgi:hypothetical protein
MLAAAGFPSSGGVLFPFLLGGPEKEGLKGEVEWEGVKGVGVLACFQATNAIIQRFSQVAREKLLPL